MHGNASCPSAPHPPAESLQAWARSRRRAMGAPRGNAGLGPGGGHKHSMVSPPSWLQTGCHGPGVIYNRSVAMGGEKGWAGLAGGLSNPVCCLSCSRRWGRERSRRRLVPGLCPELRGISPHTFTAVFAPPLRLRSSQSPATVVSGTTLPARPTPGIIQLYPTARLRCSRMADGRAAGGLLLHLAPCVLPAGADPKRPQPLGPSLHLKSPFLQGINGEDQLCRVLPRAVRAPCAPR